MTRKKFTNDTFEQAFIYMKCSRKAASKKLQIEIDDDTNGMCTMMDDGTVVIWTEESTGDDVLVHEVVHAMHFTLDRAGVKQLDTEVCAYLTQAIWRQCKC